MTGRTSTLLFVYNADSGPLNALWDAGHKLVSPATYPCALCAITHGAVAMRAEWRAHLRHLPYPAVFLHRDEFRRAYPEAGIALPAVLLEEGGALTILVAAADLQFDQSVAALIRQIDAALSERGSASS